jgi:hypothetical protein
MTNKEVLYRVFEKYDRMKKILAYYEEVPPHQHQKLTQSFKDVVVQSSRSGENAVDRAIIREDDARYYIMLIDKAIEQLPNTQQKPYQKIIKYRYVMKPHYTMIKISIMIGYSVESYKNKLKEAQEELIEILDLWAVNY